jgi:hypothetical protein
MAVTRTDGQMIGSAMETIYRDDQKFLHHNLGAVRVKMPAMMTTGVPVLFQTATSMTSTERKFKIFPATVTGTESAISAIVKEVPAVRLWQRSVIVVKMLLIILLSCLPAWPACSERPAAVLVPKAGEVSIGRLQLSVMPAIMIAALIL